MFKIIYKEKNISSFKAISKFKIENKIKKIGHTGTLDPLAQGLLLIATNEDTKLISYISNKDKEYKVQGKLGYISKTYDEEGPITFFSDYVPSYEEVVNTINSFLGTIKQKPPIFSSKKINGNKAYELARKNIDVNLKEIEVSILEIKNIKYDYPYFSFDVLVSNGTYIRSLINDIGRILKTGAYMTFLERTMISNLRMNDKIDVYKLINLDVYKIKNAIELKEWFNGKIKTLDVGTKKTLLNFNGKIIGVVNVENNIIIKTNLLGNRILKLLNLKE